MGSFHIPLLSLGSAGAISSLLLVTKEGNGWVFSVLCGYKLQECVHNHWSGLNVRVIKGTMEITPNAATASPFASIY